MNLKKPIVRNFANGITFLLSSKLTILAIYSNRKIKEEEEKSLFELIRSLFRTHFFKIRFIQIMLILKLLLEFYYSKSYF